MGCCKRDLCLWYSIEMSSVCDSYWSRDYHDDTEGRVHLSGTRSVSMGFVHKEVRDAINHAHSTKVEMVLQIHSILTNLPRGIWSTAKRRLMKKYRRSWPLMTSHWRPFMPSWMDSPLLSRINWASTKCLKLNWLSWLLLLPLLIHGRSRGNPNLP